MNRNTRVGLYLFPDDADYWFVWHEEDHSVYACLCEDCAANFSETTWIGDDEYFTCDICGSGGEDDWESEE